MIGSLPPPGNFLISAVASYPPITGIWTSIRTKSYASTPFSRIFSTAILPFSATSTIAPCLRNWMICIFRLRLLSSAISTFLPSREIFLRCGSAGSTHPTCGSANLNSTATRNSDPSPFFDVSDIWPPIFSTRFFVMAIPSPVPWIPDTVVLLSRVKASKMVLENSSSIPMPLSFTRNS